MAEKRCFSKEVVRSGSFLDMPSSAQCLYFQIGLETDERGVCPNAKIIAKICNSSVDDLKLLIVKKFLISLDNDLNDMNIVLDKLFYINNTLEHPTKRFKESQYFDKIKNFRITEKLTYSESEPGIPLEYGKMFLKDEAKNITRKIAVSDRCPTDARPKIREDKLSKDKLSIKDLKNKNDETDETQSCDCENPEIIPQNLYTTELIKRGYVTSHDFDIPNYDELFKFLSGFYESDMIICALNYITRISKGREIYSRFKYFEKSITDSLKVLAMRNERTEEGYIARMNELFNVE